MKKLFLVLCAVMLGLVTAVLLYNTGAAPQKVQAAVSVSSPAPANPDPSDYQVAFYEDINYGGHYFMSSYDRDYNDLRSLYLENNSKNNWNDKISSMKIGKYVCATVWKDINYRGASTPFSGDGNSMKSYSDLRTVGWHDNISSVKVRAHDNCSTK